MEMYLPRGEQQKRRESVCLYDKYTSLVIQRHKCPNAGFFALDQHTQKNIQHTYPAHPDKKRKEESIWGNASARAIAIIMSLDAHYTHRH